LRQGRSPSELADSLGVSARTLRNWRRKDQLDRHERDDAVTSDEREELARLRRENTRLPQGRKCAEASRGLLPDGERDPVSCYRTEKA